MEEVILQIVKKDDKIEFYQSKEASVYEIYGFLKNFVQVLETKIQYDLTFNDEVKNE